MATPTVTRSSRVFRRDVTPPTIMKTAAVWGPSCCARIMNSGACFGYLGIFGPVPLMSMLVGSASATLCRK